MPSRLTEQEKALRAITERQLGDFVRDAARTFGWLSTHFRPAITNKGYRTPLQGDPGFPDNVLAGHGRVLFAELKRELTFPHDMQVQWLNELALAGMEVFVWRPRDWASDEIVRVLRGATDSPTRWKVTVA